jgi:hypothetical protein
MNLPSLTINLPDDLLERFAEILAHEQAKQALADAGMTPADTRRRADTRQSIPDDPWNDDGSADAGGFADAPAAISAPPRRQSAPSRQMSARTTVVDTPKGQQRWTFGAANAPMCQCSPPEPAAYVEGKTNGRAWRRWTCALGGSRDSWQNKCDFSQWA